MCVILVLVMFLTSFPVNGGGTVRAEETDPYHVLLWTTKTTTNQQLFDKLETIYKNATLDGRKIEVTSEYKSKDEEENHFDGTENLAEQYDLIWIILPQTALDANDLRVLKLFTEAGGRIVLAGENVQNYTTENENLTAVAQALGTSFTITKNEYLRPEYADYVNVDSDLLGGEALMSPGTIKFEYFAEISYQEPAELIVSHKNMAGVVDQAVGKGRITVTSDTNWYTTSRNNAATDLLLRFLKNSRKNMDIVEDGDDPNKGFGRSCSLKGSITVRDHTWSTDEETGDGKYFYKELQEVAITAEDEGCGIRQIDTYISDKQMTEEELQALSEEDWEKQDSTVQDNADQQTSTTQTAKLILSDEDAPHIVYARLTDQNDNVIYLSTEWIIIDTVPPMIGGIDEENPYCQPVTVSVQEKYPAGVTVDGQELTADADGNYTVEPNGKDRVIEAVDLAGNRTAVTLKNGHAWEYRASGNVIYANCKNEGCEYQTESLTLTLLAETPVVWDGQSYGRASVENQITAVTGEEAGELCFYPAGEDNSWKEEEKLSATPSEPGYYRVSVTLGGQTAETFFRIEKKNDPPVIEPAVTDPVERKDTTAPSGTIRLQSDSSSWTEWREKIAFTKFYKTAQTIEIEASDEESGVETVSYLISRTEQSREQLKDAAWIPYTGAFRISPDIRCIIYAKITDKAGNVSWLATDGIVLEAPDDEEDIWKYEEVAALEQTITSQKTDDDIKGSRYNKVRVRAVSVKKDRMTLKWNRIADADGYIVYGNRCNHDGIICKMKKLKTVKNPGSTQWTHKHLKKGVYYKHLVVAYKVIDGKKKVLSVSKTAHAITAGGKFQNPKAVRIKQKGITVKKGKRKKIRAVRVMPRKGKMREHVDRFRYESTAKKIAAVDKKGRVTGKKAGICYIYVYLQNGIYKRIKVTVK